MQSQVSQQGSSLDAGNGGQGLISPMCGQASKEVDDQYVLIWHHQS